MQFLAKQSCGSLLFLVLWRFIKFATVVQAEYNIDRLHSAMSHGRDQEFLFPIGAESENGSQVIPTSCLNLLWAFDDSVRTGGSSTADRDADRMNPKQVRSEATHGANA